MRRRLPMHVETWRDRHGKVRVYFRKGKKDRRIALPALDAPDFGEAYADAMAGKAREKPTRRRTAAKDTLAGLIVSYKQSAAFIERKASTRRNYALCLDRMRRAHGHRTVSGMTPPGIEKFVLAPLAGKPGARLMTLKLLRILIRHGIRIGWLTHDPSVGIKRPRSKEIRSWTDAEIAAFETRWPIGTKQRLALALFLYVGQRVSDVARMGWPDVSDNAIRVVQQKTGTELLIPLHQAAREIVADARRWRRHVTLLATAYGRPFTTKGLGQWMRDAITRAGLPLACQPHGLRKAAGRRLAEAGCTAHEIMAILGHKTLAEAERYTREADQKRLSGSGIAKLEQKRNGLPKP